MMGCMNMRLIDADLLLRNIQNTEIEGAGIRNRALTNAFRRLFSETVNEMPTVNIERYENKYCPECGKKLFG